MSVRPEWHVLNKNGEIVLKTYDKALADLHDAKLTRVEKLLPVIEPINNKLGLSEVLLEDLAMYLVEHADDVSAILTKSLKERKIRSKEDSNR